MYEDFEEQEYDDFNDRYEPIDDEDDNEVEIFFDELHAGQQKVVESNASIRVLCCGRRWGKTLVSINIALNAMLEGEKVAYMTPYSRLGRKFFKEFVKKIPAKLIENSNKADGLIELTNGGEISFFSGENPDQVRGHSFHKVIIDEAAMIPNLEDIWHGDIEPTLLEYSGKALIISTPKGRNFFYQLFKRGENGEAGIESFHYPSSSNPYLPKKWLEDRRKAIPEARFREEYQAIPGENSGNPFSQIDVLANTIEELSNKPSVIYGIDLAKTVDYSVIVGLDEDGSMSYFDRWQTSHTDNMERIKRLPKDAPKIIDSTGAGDAIYEMLKYKVYNLVPFVFTQASKPRIMLELIKDVQNHNIKFNKMTADEMMVFEHYETQTGHIKYEAMAGCHDDCIMALAMANFYKAKAFNILNWKLYTV